MISSEIAALRDNDITASMHRCQHDQTIRAEILRFRAPQNKKTRQVTQPGF
jgi:hypothetical protein